MDAALLEQEAPLLFEELRFLGVGTDRRSPGGAGGAAFLATAALLAGAAGFVFGAAFGAAFFGAGFFGAAFFGGAFFGTAFGAAFFGGAFFGTACFGDLEAFGAEVAAGLPLVAGFLALAAGFFAEAGFLAFAAGLADVLFLAFAAGFFTGVTSTSSTVQPVAPPPPDDRGAGSSRTVMSG